MGVGCGLPDYMDEAAQREGAQPARRRRCKASSEGLNLERKEETMKMWLLVGGGGRKFMNGAAKNWRASVVDMRPVDCSRRTFLRKPYMREPQDILYCIAHDSC